MALQKKQEEQRFGNNEAPPPRRGGSEKERGDTPLTPPPNNCHNEVSVAFKIYTKVEKDSRGELNGDKGSAVNADKGYVYIFRKLREKEAGNGDGTRTRFYWEVDVSRTNGVALDRESFGETNSFFFAYSRFKLSDPRKEVIRKDLDEFIKSSPANGPRPVCRALYIPLKPTGIKLPYMHNGSILHLDMELQHTDRACIVTIFLHDWYGYIEKCAQQYQKKLEAHRKNLNSEVTLANYASMPNSHNLGKDKFTIAQLYPLTSIIAEIVEKSPAKFGNNMRQDIQAGNDVTERSVSINYDYKLFWIKRKVSFRVCGKTQNLLFAPFLIY